MSGKTDRQRVIDCPRCGYDQRGVVETWAQSCPMRGRCSECGLDFAWVDLFRPELGEPLWCIELAVGRLPVLTGGWRTFLRSFTPWRFWSRLQMQHEISPRRLVGYVALLVVLLFGAYAVQQTAIALRVHAELAEGASAKAETAIRLTQLVWRSGQSFTVAGTVISPPTDLASQKQAEAVIRSKYVIEHSALEAVLESVFTPAQYSSGLRFARSVNDVPNDDDLLHRLSTATNPGMGYLGWTLKSPRRYAPLMLQALTFLGLPLAFVLLRVSRRRANVRWRHIARLTVYSMWIPVTTLVLGLLLGATSYVSLSSEPLIDRITWPLLNSVTLPATYLWWAFAIRNYMKIAHWWFVAGALMIIVGLIVVSVAFVISPDVALSMLDLNP